MSGLSLLKGLADLDQAHYPETIHRVFIINAPFIFYSIWAIISTWADKRTVDKFHILGSDFQKTLLEYISADNLPVKYGGSCTCSHMSTGCIPGLE
jgi:hypothetical protein